MKLIALTEFRDVCLVGERKPDLRTLRIWTKAGKLPGGKVIAGNYFVDLDQLEAPTGNELADKVAAANEALAKAHASGPSFSRPARRSKQREAA